MSCCYGCPPPPPTLAEVTREGEALSYLRYSEHLNSDSLGEVLSTPAVLQALSCFNRPNDIPSLVPRPFPPAVFDPLLSSDWEA